MEVFDELIAPTISGKSILERSIRLCIYRKLVLACAQTAFKNIVSQELVSPEELSLLTMNVITQVGLASPLL
jgi:hypothetical protein